MNSEFLQQFDFSKFLYELSFCFNGYLNFLFFLVAVIVINPKEVMDLPIFKGRTKEFWVIFFFLL